MSGPGIYVERRRPGELLDIRPRLEAALRLRGAQLAPRDSAAYVLRFALRPLPSGADVLFTLRNRAGRTVWTTSVPLRELSAGTDVAAARLSAAFRSGRVPG